MNEKMNELFNLLDEFEAIKKMEYLQKKISDTEIDLINQYRINSTIENKKKLYDNKIIKEYLDCENEINYLIMQINAKFKRRKICESNKW